jgi:hypothetical protein
MIHRFRDQETTIEQVYLGDLVEAVEALTAAVSASHQLAERNNPTRVEPVLEELNMETDS